jgi:allantoicase
MNDFTHLPDLATSKLGGSVLYASDDFFASCENLLLPGEAVFIEGKYTDRGKWMDGWESRRRREHAYTTPGPYPESDFAIVRLGLPGIVHGVVVDTAFFTGNFPAECMLEGVAIAGVPTRSSLLDEALLWTPILSRQGLLGGTKNAFEIASRQRFTHLRLRIFPDGGVARLRVHGVPMPEPRWMGQQTRPQLVDLAAVEHGAMVVSCNDMFFGSRHNLIMPGRGVNMGDGWETKRGRRPGPDWVVVRLAAAGMIERAIVDTTHFKGNAPDFVALDIAHVERGAPEPDASGEDGWLPLLPKTNVEPHSVHTFEDELSGGIPATHVRLRIWPDGGVSRLRLFGIVTETGREAVGLAHLRAMDERALSASLTSCCGSTRWVDRMCEARAQSACPYGSLAALQQHAEKVWNALSSDDWAEAFLAHPRIGEQTPALAQSAAAAAWSRREQARVDDASQATKEALAATNADYEAKFGRRYIVCATGKSAEEMLSIAKERMQQAPDVELRCAADEQRKITALRLAKLVIG